MLWHLPLQAENCTAPLNLVQNPTFDSGLNSYVSTGSWQFNQSLDPGVYGTVYNTRTAVVNGAAAPTGNEANSYPTDTLRAFVINEDDGANDTLEIGKISDDLVSYSDTGLQIYFDMGWRQAGGTQSYTATLDVVVNGTTYMTISTFNGTSAGNATGALFNGATLGTGTGLTYYNPGGNGALSQWNTISLIVPFNGTVMPDISFVMSGSNGVSDDFNLDRIYIPVCRYEAVVPVKQSQILYDPVHGTINPKAIPGAHLRYCIIVTNPANGANKTSVAVSDNISALPISFVPGSIRVAGTANGSTCNDDGAIGGSYVADTIMATIGSLAAGSAKTVYFEVEVQ
ncbi:MAG: hypothetical protein ABJ143_06355 [Parasphingorhabdus sp.]